MKQFLLSILLLMITLGFSSCFEILEELQLNANGQGEYTLIINMSESKAKLNSIMVLDSIQGYKVPKKSDISSNLESVKQKIAKINGLSNVKTNFDYNEYIATIKFSFTNVQQINAAMQLVLNEYKIKNYSLPIYNYIPTTQQLIRTYKTQPKTVEQYQKLKSTDKEIFTKARYTSIYKFSNLVKASQNPLAKISKNQKAVMQQSTLQPIILNQTEINQLITLQP